MKGETEVSKMDSVHTERFQKLVDEADLAGISRKMIGSACGMTANGVTQYYLGNRPIGFDAALKFSQFFEVPTEHLYTKVSEIVVDPELDRMTKLIRRIPESEMQRLRKILLGLVK